MSYPDLVEEDGQYYLTETQKEVARVHRIDSSLLQGLWDQFERADLTREGQLLEVDEPGPAVVDMPALPPFVRRSGHSPYGTDDLRTGFSLELWFQLDSSVAGRVLLDTRLENGQGFVLQHKGNGQLELVLDDGRTRASWDSDPRVVSVGKRHHAVVIVDGGPNVISFVVDGRLCDGGDFRQFGWGRFSPHLRHANGSPRLLVDGAIDLLRVYGRALRTSEAISNFRSGDGV